MSVFGSLDTPYILSSVIQNYIRAFTQYHNILVAVTRHTIHYARNIVQSLNLC